MMEQRRALTIPFTVDKDNLMDPLRIPISCLSSNCGEVERQVSWTAFAARKLRHCDSQHKNGSMLFDHNHTAIVTLEMARRKPCLILTDVLKTEPGKAYMDRIKQSRTSENGGRVSGTRRESGRCRVEPLICRNRRSSQREDSCDNKQSVTPKCNQKNPSPPLQRSRLRRRLQNQEDEANKEENKDIEEVIIGNDQDDDDRFAEVVDCGLSVSWEPSEDTGGVHSLKRKRKNDDVQCNGSDSPRCRRESVLRLSGEDGRDGGPAATRVCLEQSGESVDLDPSIVQFTVGADDDTEILVPNVSLNSKAGDLLGSPRRRSSSDQDSTTKASPAEPIVLSSDEEESCGDSQPCSPAAHTHFTVEDTAMSPVKDIQPEDSDIQGLQVLHVLLDDPPRLEPESLSPTADYACMGVAFSTLHCGGYGGIANGNIMIADQKLIIPLKDTSGQVELLLTFERKELRKYSIWEQQELEERELQFKCDEDPWPPAFLLLCVSETAAAAVHQDLLKLCAKRDETRSSGEASPFILLTLRDVLEGMEGALLRSVLDIDCLNSPHEKSITPDGADRLGGLGKSPVLSLDDCIELIGSTGLDSHLLSLLGLESTDRSVNTEQHSPRSDRDTDTTSLTLLEVDAQKEKVLKTATEQDAETQLEPEEDETKQDLEPSDPSEEPKDKSTPVYTLCQRRTKGCYSVSMCKPDPSWTKYKHRGAARRLIQFPPPPLKGGITVTMEDLQCLDNGQFLNDVIIDFYLKYLLQNAPAAVAARSHIFSSFFYKQLTRRDNASEGTTNESCQRQRRHQRVKTWTRHVDIFNKDFLFVPVNQEAHWYMVVICFPGLDEPKYEAWNDPNPEKGKSNEGTDDEMETPATLNHSENKDTDTENPPEESAKDPAPGPVNCTERTCKKKTVCKRPCILIMDSLKLSLHERVFKLLRDYLQSEWEVRRGSSRDFGPDQMQSSHCLVPLQDNSSDCGLYLLQYVESFLKDPVVHFDLPLHLKRWFPRQQVRRKRDEIRNLVLNLYRHQNLDSSR